MSVNLRRLFAPVVLAPRFSFSAGLVERLWQRI